jgi:hypothetical protein
MSVMPRSRSIAKPTRAFAVTAPGQALAYVYFEEELPELLRKP